MADNRFQTAAGIASALYTPSVEEKCRALAENRVIGRAMVLDRLVIRERHAMGVLYDWMLANGWTGGSSPDFDALLIEEPS